METPAPQVRVTIPPALRPLCDANAPMRRAELCLAGGSVRQVLAELARLHPRVYVMLCDERGDPRPHINVFVNHDHVRARAGLDTPLATGDLVTILPAVSGG